MADGGRRRDAPVAGIRLYGIALFAVQGFITGERRRKVYHYLNAFGLTPWIALHMFYNMILTLFAWLNRNGFAADATAICEGLYAPLAWLVPVSEALMLPVFVYWFRLQIGGRIVWFGIMLIRERKTTQGGNGV